MLIDAALGSRLADQTELGEQQISRSVEPDAQPASGEGALSQRGLERLITELARSIDPVLGAAGPIQPVQQRPFSATDQFQSPFLDKREYIKPCSFNAVSCVRNPFRKQQRGRSS